MCVVFNELSWGWRQISSHGWQGSFAWLLCARLPF